MGRASILHAGGELAGKEEITEAYSARELLSLSSRNTFFLPSSSFQRHTDSQPTAETNPNELVFPEDDVYFDGEKCARKEEPTVCFALYKVSFLLLLL